MAKYLVAETQAVWVTWVREIEADSEEEARAEYQEGHGKPIGEPDIGENVEGMEQYIECQKIQKESRS